MDFNCLCKMVYDYRCVSSNNYNISLHKLKYIGNEEWIWMVTFDYNLCIPRCYKQNVIGIRLLKLLSEASFSDFIIFSGLTRDEALKEIKVYYNKNEIVFDPDNCKMNCYIAKSEKDAKEKFDFFTTDENLDSYLKDKHIAAIKMQSKKAIHWIELQILSDFSDTQTLRLEWKQSVGNMSLMQKRRNLDEHFSSEENLIHVKQRIILLADAPGTGKSSILTRVIQRIKNDKPTALLIEINLNELQRAQVSFSVKSKQELINLLFRVLKKTCLRVIEKKIMEYKANQPEELVLFFDGFDEVRIEKQESVLNLFKFIVQETKANIWITTRQQNKEELEIALCVLSFSLNPLSMENQIEFLNHFWRVGLKFSGRKLSSFTLRSYAKVVTKLFISDIFQVSSFIELPLRLRSVAEIYLCIFIDVLQENIENNDLILKQKFHEIEFADTLESFVRHVYDIYFFEKIKIDDFFDEESQDIQRNTYSNAYRNFAAKHICRNDSDPTLNFKDKKEQVSLVTLSKIGLIQKCYYSNLHQPTTNVFSNSIEYSIDNFEFTHPYLAQFFAADFICIELKNNPSSRELWEFLIDKILFLPFSRIVFENRLKNDTELSCLSAQNCQKWIVLDLLYRQFERYGTAKVLWEANEKELHRAFVFLKEWYFNMKWFHGIFYRRKILNILKSPSKIPFTNDNDSKKCFMNQKTKKDIDLKFLDLKKSMPYIKTIARRLEDLLDRNRNE